MKEKFDHLRTATLLGLRGHDDQFGALVIPTPTNGVDYGLIFRDNSGYLDMCGHSTKGVTTALIELGMIEPEEPCTEIIFETVAGLVHTKALVKDVSVGEVSLVDMQASVSAPSRWRCKEVRPSRLKLLMAGISLQSRMQKI